MKKSKKYTLNRVGKYIYTSQKIKDKYGKNGEIEIEISEDRGCTSISYCYGWHIEIQVTLKKFEFWFSVNAAKLPIILEKFSAVEATIILQTLIKKFTKNGYKFDKIK